MVYSTIHGHISVLNHHHIPSVSIWSTHRENESQDITSICWNFLWTCPVYFALQIEAKPEVRNIISCDLISVPITIQQRTPCQSVHQVHICWSRNELGNHCEYTAWHWFWFSHTTLREFRRRTAPLKKTSEEHICIYSPSCLNQRTDQQLLLSLLTDESLGIPTCTWASIFLESAEVRAWFPREGKIFSVLLCLPAPQSAQLD